MGFFFKKKKNIMFFFFFLRFGMDFSLRIFVNISSFFCKNGFLELLREADFLKDKFYLLFVYYLFVYYIVYLPFLNYLKIDL